MMARQTILFALASTFLACSATQPPAPAPAPDAATPPATGEPDSAGPSTEAPEPEPDRSKEIALELVEEGRAIQTQRGEGGAHDAIDVYLRALEQDAECGAALWELGWSYQVLGRLDDAVAAWDKLKALDPDFPELQTYYPVLIMRRDHAAAIASLPDPGKLPPPEETPRDGPTITISAVGDVHMGRAWPESRSRLPPNDAKEMFTAVADTLKDADITFGNLETVLKDDGPSTKCGPRSTKCFSFRVPTSFAGALKEAGFDVMSIANNHAGDFGPEGRQTTMETLDSIGILHSGPIGDIASWETKGLKMAMVAFSTGSNVYRLQETEAARKVVADLARKHDLVIVSFHGGAEGAAAAHVPKAHEKFYGESRGDVYRFAHSMIDTGADLVIGHGPHRLRGMEIYKGRFIAYSLGNFSTWKTFSLSGALGISTVLKVKLAPNGVVLEAKVNPVIIRDPGLPHPDPKDQAIKTVRDLSRQDFGNPVIDKNGSYQRPKPAS
ncbi:CapA family protein [Myxococcota bacterium]